MKTFELERKHKKKPYKELSLEQRILLDGLGGAVWRILGRKQTVESAYSLLGIKIADISSDREEKFKIYGDDIITKAMDWAEMNSQDNIIDTYVWILENPEEVYDTVQMLNVE